MTMKHSYTFVWSPTGRPIATYRAKTETLAKRQFKRDYRYYAKHMGEVYVIVDEPDATRLGVDEGEAF